MKKVIVFMIALLAITSVNAQKLTPTELTSTFKQSSKESLEKFLAQKGFEFFRRNVSSNGRDTCLIYRPKDRSKAGFFEFNRYKIPKTNQVYNYKINYTLFNSKDFNAFENLLELEKYKKQKDGEKQFYLNDDFRLDLEVIKVTELARAYRIIITNYNLGSRIFEILADQMLNSD